jgi:hypothetical protein
VLGFTPFAIFIQNVHYRSVNPTLALNQRASQDGFWKVDRAGPVRSFIEVAPVFIEHPKIHPSLNSSKSWLLRVTLLSEIPTIGKR